MVLVRRNCRKHQNKRSEYENQIKWLRVIRKKDSIELMTKRDVNSVEEFQTKRISFIRAEML